MTATQYLQIKQIMEDEAKMYKAQELGAFLHNLSLNNDRAFERLIFHEVG